MSGNSQRPISRVLVTGCAGFVGSHLCEALLEDGIDVVGVDSFTPTYDVEQKLRNLENCRQSNAFTLHTVELADAALADLAADVDTVFHLAGEPGVRSSWGSSFARYTANNIDATQSLLEALKLRTDIRVVYASSSSIYGNAEALPTHESAKPFPVSPYGVTKLAAEHLCNLYREQYGLDCVSLRYFTVFGPRQRPDMAFHLFCRSAVLRTPIHLFGDGQQTRDFTFVTDVVAATLAAARVVEASGLTFNVGGGVRVAMTDVLEVLANLSSRPLIVERTASAAGDVRHTGADTTAARAVLGWAPRMSFPEGLAAEFAWIQAESQVR